MERKRIAIIGAGPAGLTAAYKLSEHIGKDLMLVDVYESTDKLGGLARSLHLWNQTVDLGPHRFFSHDTRVNELWLEVVKDQYDMVNRLTRIYYKKKFYYYPLKALNALSNLGIGEAIRCIFSYMGQKFKRKRVDDNFESWVSRQFGKRLYQLFFKTYTEKLWGISCSELDADFASQRIKKLSLFAAIINSLNLGNKKKHKTLVDEFAFPYAGTGWVYEEMARLAVANGASILLNSPVKRVLTKDGAVSGIELANGAIKEYDIVISSMPLSLMAAQLGSVPESVLAQINQLYYRNTIMVFLKVESKNVFPDQWIYVHASELKTGRICNFRNWLPSLYGDESSSILALEYWCFDDDEMWRQTDSDLIAMATDEIRATGLIGEAAVSNGHVEKIHRSYPVYFKGYKDVLQPVQDFVSSIKNLMPIGRYGAYKYNNQDHSILMGLLVAENIVKNENHNLWDINTDYESYQEQSLITKTGLNRGK